MIYDTIVIGAGPGGAMAASELRRQGLSVLALERARHPRHKSCGGGLSYRVHQILEPGFQSVVEDVIETVRFTFSGREEFVVPCLPMAYMVIREDFDCYMARRAVEQGSELKEEEPVVSVQEHAEFVEVKTRKHVYVARYIIGADGANSIVARSLRANGRRRPAFSMESELHLNGQSVSMEHEILIELGHIPGGYAWVFPKERRLSLGLAGFMGKSERPKDYYHRFVEGQKRLAKGKMGPVLGHPIPLFHRSMPPLASSRMVVVGDAAHLVDPLFGEGIYYALRSGQMAARCIAEVHQRRAQDLTLYDRRVRAELYPDLRAAYWMARAVYLFPYLTFRVFQRHPKIIQDYARVMRGELSYQALVSLLYRKALGYLWKSFSPRVWFRSLKSS